jgi:CMP-N-acetylneuraminic acid synthetase
MTPRIVAIVPMRHDSERVKGKNYRLLGDRPLFHHIVVSLLACRQVAEVVIDTDSPLITADAGKAFPDVRVLARPEHLRGGDVPMNEVLLHDINQIPADLYLQTHSTNPLLRSTSVDRAIETFLGSQGQHDSLFTVTPLQTRLWTADATPINHDPSILMRTQDLEPVMEENSCLYIFDGPTLRDRRNRIGARPLLYPLDAHEAWDIDDELDWLVTEALYSDRVAGK